MFLLLLLLLLTTYFSDTAHKEKKGHVQKHPRLILEKQIPEDKQGLCRNVHRHRLPVHHSNA